MSKSNIFKLMPLFFAHSLMTMQSNREMLPLQILQNKHVRVATLDESDRDIDYYNSELSPLDNKLAELSVKHSPDRVKEILGVIKNKQENPIKPLLLTGPSGVGKTTMAQAIAQAALCKSKLLPLAIFGNKYLYSVQESLRQNIAPLLETDQPEIIILDNLEVLEHYTKVYGPLIYDGGKRGVIHDTKGLAERLLPVRYVDSPARTLSHLLFDFDHDKKTNVVFIGTAKSHEKVNPIIRKHFEVIPLQAPDFNARCDALKYLISRMSFSPPMTKENIEYCSKSLAQQTEGYQYFGLKNFASNLQMTLMTEIAQV